MAEQETQTKTIGKPFKPVTFWLANPFLELRLKHGSQYIKFSNGRYTARSQEEAEAIRKNGMAFEQDMTEAPEPHPISMYAPLSFKAYMEHQKQFPVTL